MELVNLLKKIVKIPSVFPEERKLAIFLEKELRKSGFKTGRQNLNKTRFNVIGEKGAGLPCIFFYGHIDTVKPCEGWKDSPFLLKIKGDKAYGLGAFDMKGGLAVILETLRVFKPRNFKLKIAFGIDEENISQGSALLTKSGWLKDVDLVLTPEIVLDKKPLKIFRYSPVITLGRRGRVALKISVGGKASHAALPRLGLNAIEGAADIIKALKNIPLANHKKLGCGSICVLKIRGGTDFLSVPESAEIIIDRHLVPPETKNSVIQQVRALVKKPEFRDYNIKVDFVERATSFLMPYLTSERDELVKLISKVIKEKYGKVAYGYGLSVADENRFGATLNLPVVVMSPMGGNVHGYDEWVSLKSLRELVEIFSSFLQEIDRISKV